MGSARGMSLTVLGEIFAICRMQGPTPPTSGPDAGPLYATTLTEDSCTVVCTENRIPEGCEAETGWSCLKVEGPLPFSQTGVLATFTGPLAAAEIPVFVLSTYETDYVLVKATKLPRAIEVLTSSGYDIRRAS